MGKPWYPYILPKKYRCRNCPTKKRLHIGLMMPEPTIPYISCPDCGAINNIEDYRLNDDMILKYLIQGQNRKRYRP